ncbi:MAG: RNA polymerase sigma factor SigI [Paenibacillaceae bacterium]
MLLLVLFKRFIGKPKLEQSGAHAVDSLEEQVLIVQDGDLALRDRIITDYQPFIAKITSRFCRRYIDPSRDDEFSIALDGFNEALNKFSSESGRSFLSFAETVIRRRLIDYLRKEQRFQQQVPLSSFEVVDEENQIINPVEVHQAVQYYEKERIVEDRGSEIKDFSTDLLVYGITFTELAECSPKHIDSRRLLMGIGRTLASNDHLMLLLRSKKMLPIKELLDLLDVSRKTLERNRKYLIAVALIYSGSYPYLRDYLYGDPTSTERSG